MSGSNLFRGTLDLIILQTLKRGRLHGYGIGQWIREASDGALEVEEGVLYPALRRLEDRGWIRGEWGKNDTGRRARFYTLTPDGRKALGKEMARWKEHAGGVFSLLRRAEG